MGVTQHRWGVLKTLGRARLRVSGWQQVASCNNCAAGKEVLSYGNIRSACGQQPVMISTIPRLAISGLLGLLRPYSSCSGQGAALPHQPCFGLIMPNKVCQIPVTGLHLS